MTHCPMRTVIKLSHLQVMNTVSRLPTGSGGVGGGGGGVLPHFQAFIDHSQSHGFLLCLVFLLHVLPCFSHLQRERPSPTSSKVPLDST